VSTAAAASISLVAIQLREKCRFEPLTAALTDALRAGIASALGVASPGSQNGLQIIETTPI
jgi:hypothetical protein